MSRCGGEYNSSQWYTHTAFSNLNLALKSKMEIYYALNLEHLRCFLKAKRFLGSIFSHVGTGQGLRGLNKCKKMQHRSSKICPILKMQMRQFECMRYRLLQISLDKPKNWMQFIHARHDLNLTEAVWLKVWQHNHIS